MTNKNSKIVEEYNGDILPIPKYYTPANNETKEEFLQKNNQKNLENRKKANEIYKSDYKPQYFTTKDGKKEEFEIPEKYRSMVNTGKLKRLYGDDLPIPKYITREEGKHIND